VGRRLLDWFAGRDRGRQGRAAAARRDVAALWARLRSGDIQAVCSDHTSCTLRQKTGPSLTVATVRNGVANRRLKDRHPPQP